VFVGFFLFLGFLLLHFFCAFACFFVVLGCCFGGKGFMKG
jgi:hypothetical protein